MQYNYCVCTCLIIITITEEHTHLIYSTLVLRGIKSTGVPVAIGESCDPGLIPRKALESEKKECLIFSSRLADIYTKFFQPVCVYQHPAQ